MVRFAAWAVAVAVSLAVAADTRIGPVLLTLSPRHGVHAGDVVAVALVMGVIVMVVVARPVGMIFVAMVFMIVIMGLEGCALAEFKFGRARDLHKLDHMRVRR